MSATSREAPSGDGRAVRGSLRRRWADAPVRRKTLSVVLLIALVTLPPLIGGLMRNARLSDARADAAGTSRSIDDLGTLQDSVLGATSAINSYILLGSTDAAFVEAYRVAADRIPGELATFREGLPAEARATGADLATAVDALLAALDPLTTPGAGLGPSGDTVGADLGAPGVEEALARIYRSVDATADAYRQIDAMDTELTQIHADDLREIDRLQRFLVRNTFVSVGAALAAAVIGILIVTSGILRRIELLSTNGERFLRGEGFEPSPPSADELGRLGDKMLYVSTLLHNRREEAEAATRAKDELLQGVSHELTTPLAAMIARARTLVDDPGLSPESVDDAGHIVRAGEHLRGLIQEMLDIKAIEAGQLDLAVDELRLSGIASECVGLVHRRAIQRAITIASDIDDDLVVAADPRRLREIVLNLLSNAIKYNVPSGRVDLSAVHRDGRVRISVTDTGIGIAPEDQKRLFRPFERLGAGDTDIEGSGIGLSLTKHVVEAMDGTVGVDSVPGTGTTFWFELPAAPPVTAGRGSIAPTP